MYVNSGSYDTDDISPSKYGCIGNMHGNGWGGTLQVGVGHWTISRRRHDGGVDGGGPATRQQPSGMLMVVF